jgi:hypothetical protein
VDDGSRRLAGLQMRLPDHGLSPANRTIDGEIKKRGSILIIITIILIQYHLIFSICDQGSSRPDFKASVIYEPDLATYMVSSTSAKTAQSLRDGAKQMQQER